MIGDIDSLPAAPPAELAADERDLLLLKSFEQTLVRAHLAHPGPMLLREFYRLRYAIGLASLDRFAPGAAAGQQARADVVVEPSLIAPFRSAVIEALRPVLQSSREPQTKLCDAAIALRSLEAPMQTLREQLLRHHAGDFSAQELDAEVGHKQLVLIAGGGGGAGFVYIGALQRLQAAGLAPDYVVGSSIGALLGAFVARHRKADYDALLAFAKAMTAGALFAPPKLTAPHGMPGLMRLHLDGFQAAFSNERGEALKIRDLEVPYEAVVGGIRARVYDRIPSLLRTGRPKGAQRRLSDLLAERMWQLTTLVTPNLIDEVVLGRDELTRDCEVIEAMGFSAAIPGVLQFEPRQRSEAMETMLSTIRNERQLAAIVDGGVANNVPAKPAWRGVRSGRIGSRNAFYLAFDCFRPQVDPRHLWLWPVTQAVQLQMPANRPYFDWLLQFQPTLSPINLLPSPTEMDRSRDWGREQIEPLVPMLKKALEPIPEAAMPWSNA